MFALVSCTISLYFYFLRSCWKYLGLWLLPWRATRKLMWELTGVFLDWDHMPGPRTTPQVEHFHQRLEKGRSLLLESWLGSDGLSLLVMVVLCFERCPPTPMGSVCSSGSAAGAAGCDRQLCWSARADLEKWCLCIAWPYFCWCYCRWKIKGCDAMLFKWGHWLRSWGSQWTVAVVPRRRERMWEWLRWLERFFASMCRWERWYPGLKFVKAFPRFMWVHSLEFTTSHTHYVLSRLSFQTHTTSGGKLLEVEDCRFGPIQKSEARDIPMNFVPWRSKKRRKLRTMYSKR